MEIKEEIKIELLNKDSVSVVVTKYIEYEGQKLEVGESTRTGYTNSKKGREELKEQIKEPYLGAILAVWGDKESVVYPEVEDKGTLKQM